MALFAIQSKAQRLAKPMQALGGGASRAGWVGVEVCAGYVKYVTDKYA